MNKEARQTWWKEVRSGFAVTMTIWLLLFIYCCFRAAYNEFHAVDLKQQENANKLRDLQDYAEHKEEYDQRIVWAESEVRHWQEAYQRAARGETKPDRVLGREDQDTLYEALARISRDAKNKEYVKLRITSVDCERESRGFAYQLFDVFRKAHWDVPQDPKFNKKEMAALNANAVEGITIFSDDMSKAMFVQSTLRFAGGIDSQVYPLPWPSLKGTIIMVGVK